jgi:hypothetical protein
MTYTRRMVLREAARLSLGAAASTTLPFLTGCNQKPRPDPNCIAPDMSTFCLGIRVFFIGGWLFCKDPIGKGMLAITHDMFCQGKSHTFPYGVWQNDGNFDNSAPKLSPNPTAAGSQRNAYTVTLPGFKNCFESVTDLFSDAGTRCQMSYIGNPKQDLKPDFRFPLIRVVSMPFPTRLITAGFSPSSYVNDTDQGHWIHSPGGAHATKSGEVAATHIFEYMGASSLNFNGQQVIAAPSTDYNGDFHFHTVPPIGLDQTDPTHPQEMFALLMSIIGLDSKQIKLVMPYPAAKPKRGRNVPKCVQDLELEIIYENGLLGNTASCAAGGHAIGEKG